MKNKRKLVRIVIAVAVAVGSAAVAVREVSAQTKRPRGHEATIKYWTNAKIAKAVPRAFERNPLTRKFMRSRAGNEYVNTGSQWTGGGDVNKNVGRVFFEMGGSYWTCSASAVQDTKADRSIVLTAAHCAYDETGRYGFARYWMFVPDWATLPSRYDPDGLFCPSTSLGCWAADSLVVSSEYAGAGGFNEAAVVHDYAFAVVSTGGKSNGQLDAVVNPSQASWTQQSAADDTFLFGYPAAGRYKGSALMYCRGPLDFDGRTMYQTYKVGCSMTGGSSGGPWLTPFENSGPDAGSGTVMSVNSYGYGGRKAMYGPILGAETATMFSVAQTTSSNVLVTT